MKLYNKARNDQWELSDVCMTVIARYGTGGGNIPVVLEDEMSYQKSTGTLSPGAHAGSYNGQDAYNDLLVVDDGVFNTTVGRVQGIGTSINACGARLQKRNGLGARGGWRHE